MAVAENVGINGGAANRTDSHAPNDTDPSKSNHMDTHHSNPILRSNDQNFHQQQNGTVNHKTQTSFAQQGIKGSGVQNHRSVENGDDGSEGFKREMRDLEEFLSKLNPMAEEFVPPSLGHHIPVMPVPSGGHFGYTNSFDSFLMQTNYGIANGNVAKKVYMVSS